MQTRALGRQGLRVSSLGLGCAGMSTAYGIPDDVESIATIRRAIELGITLFDTAEAYGPFVNEILIGKAIAGRREEVVIATKCGFAYNDMTITGPDSSPSGIARSVEGSLARLGTDRIDLLYQHRVDPNVPVEETVGAMGRLVEEGKVRFLGLCEVGVETMRRAHAVHPLTAVQSEYSLWERNLESEIIPAARALGIGIVPFAPLGRSFLTGAAPRPETTPANDMRRTDPRFQGENYDANMALVDRIRDIAIEYGATPPQIALAWLLACGDDIVPIPGAKRRVHLDDNAGAAAISLSEMDRKRLDALATDCGVAGARYADMRAALIDR